MKLYFTRRRGSQCRLSASTIARLWGDLNASRSNSPSITVTNSLWSGRDTRTGIFGSASFHPILEAPVRAQDLVSRPRWITIPKDPRELPPQAAVLLRWRWNRFCPHRRAARCHPAGDRHNYILQEKMTFAPVIDTPHGGTQAEVRIMYIWPPGQRMLPVMALVRMGRGKMMGVDHNRNLEWVGGSGALSES